MVHGLLERVAAHRVTATVGLVYLVALVAVGTWPTHVDQDLDVANSLVVRGLVALGFSDAAGYGVVEFSANVALSVPWGFCAARLLAPRLDVALLSGFVASVLVETVQLTFLAGRTASLLDVVANSLGAALGVGVAVWFAGRTSDADQGRPSPT